MYLSFLLFSYIHRLLESMRISIVSRPGIDFYSSYFISFISAGLTKSTSADNCTVKVFLQ